MLSMLPTSENVGVLLEEGIVVLDIVKSLQRQSATPGTLNARSVGQYASAHAAQAAPMHTDDSQGAAAQHHILSVSGQHAGLGAQPQLPAYRDMAAACVNGVAAIQVKLNTHCTAGTAPGITSSAAC